MSAPKEQARTTGQGSTALSRPPRTRLIQHVRNALLGGASLFFPAGDEPLPDLRRCKRVLLV